MNRNIILTAAIILYVITGAAALFLFRQMEMTTVVAGDTRDISLSSPQYGLETAAPEEPSEEPPEAEDTEKNTEEESPSLPPEEEAELPAPKYTYTAIHKEGRLFIREKADISAPILGSLSPGNTGNVLELGDKWALVQAGELTGYVSKDFLELAPLSE